MAAGGIAIKNKSGRPVTPNLTPEETIDQYVQMLFSDESWCFDEKLSEIVDRLQPGELYVNCWEWKLCTFFSHISVLKDIKEFALQAELPVQERIDFMERWD